MGMAIQSVKDGEAHAAVSAGNTGALMALSKIVIKTMPEIDRPALAAIGPSARGDVVLLDLSLDDGSTPAENLGELSATGARVLVYTSGDRPQLVREASRAGAIGMIRKSAPVAVMVDAVRAAARGEVVASAEWASALDLDTAFDLVLRTAQGDATLDELAAAFRAHTR